ncbi:hypothetical protein AWB79_04912 [Caballeronia hypogeia]|uniref:Uncharacterized protein n=1 Tax=Caballeronia hypogeia TaxID=1777140 RepID=A0A158C8E1_9BURK|nr:DUF6572 domain-containing protein [Caballeronia hypogeia]SAK78541.1 hypothetical protein AWB79_04912 [Caballeronia hypogeia]
MSLHDVEVIDYIGVNILFKRVYVGIFDDLDWRDEREHRRLLTKKIDSYIGYIRSGQLLTSYPNVRGYEIAIEYVSTHPMPPAALEFWKSRERILSEAGYKAQIRGVDVRHSLGMAVEQPEQVRVEPVEPPALEVLDVDPRAPLAEITDISRPAPMPSAPHRLRGMPVLRRLAAG